MSHQSPKTDPPAAQKKEEDEYSGTCFWCGLCSKTNGICVRNNQELLKTIKNKP